MVTISDTEYELFQQLKAIVKHTHPALGSYFICGGTAELDEHGLPESIYICPSYGVNTMATYRKEKIGRSGQ
jgi:hypothetical protein